MKLRTDYKAGHHYIEDWMRTNFFCPHCGLKSIWEEQGGGDYYDGPGYLCSDCGGRMCHPNKEKEVDYIDAQRMKAFKESDKKLLENP